MSIRTQQSISGFIASDPQLTETERGEARFYARFGQENFRREEDGTFSKLDTTFHNLVMYRATAERAFERFQKGDMFVAEGYVHPYSYERAGEHLEGEEFVAKKIGHDTARTFYTVERSSRSNSQEKPAREQIKSFESPRQHPGTESPGLGI